MIYLERKSCLCLDSTNRRRSTGQGKHKNRSISEGSKSRGIRENDEFIGF